MRKRYCQKWTMMIVANTMGTLWVLGCVSDLQFRDFVTTNVIRTFFQTLGSAFQAAFVAQQSG